MQDDEKKEIINFIKNCEKMDWSNINLSIFLENAINLLKKTVENN
jgi:hypothetical protein